MATEIHGGYCQRNIKPMIALLVVLVVVTIAWSVVLREKGGAGRRFRRALGAPAVVPVLAPQQAAMPGSVAGVTAANPGAATPLPALAMAAAQVTRPGNPAVDVVTLATPNGGVKFIAAVPSTPARMQLVAARNTFNTVSSLILPAVVSIHATRNPPTAATVAANAGMPFADPFDGVPEKIVRDKAYENVGSGVIIDSRGFIVTNHHVISQATEILVSVSGDAAQDYPAAVAAVDPAADLALIRVTGAPPLPEAQLGDSNAVQVGDWVLAFGSPFGLDQTVTQGIISNRRDSLVVGGVSFGAMLQTDAPINRGSSGGPLVNLKAEVVGINSAIYGPNGVFSGTGFAIPVNRAKAFLAQNSAVFER